MSIFENEIFLGILAFTVVVNLMIFVILGARKYLVSSGDINIEMNEDPDRSIIVPAGNKLLQTLAAQNLFLSSACGGKGTCAQCRCIIHEGGGAILPTEESPFTNKEKKEGWRLSCQVPVKENLKIQVPDEGRFTWRQCLAMRMSRWHRLAPSATPWRHSLHHERAWCCTPRSSEGRRSS